MAQSDLPQLCGWEALPRLSVPLLDHVNMKQSCLLSAIWSSNSISHFRHLFLNAVGTCPLSLELIQFVRYEHQDLFTNTADHVRNGVFLICDATMA